MIRLISFLGTSRYSESTVRIVDFETKQKIFPLALIEYHLKERPSETIEVIFFLTERSKQNWEDNVKPFLQDRAIKYSCVDIDENLSPTGMISDLVKKMTARVNNGDEVLLDITHSFRMIPLMAVVIALFLKETKDVEVRIVYGKYDEVTKTTECVDITGLTEIVEWIYGAKLFREYGYSKTLAKLITGKNSESYKKQDQEKPKRLSSLASALEQLSLSVRLGSIRLLRQHLAKFLELFKDTTDTREEIQRCLPQLDLLIDSIIERYKKLDANSGDILLNEEELVAERELVKFYLRTDDLGMALRVCTEYLINILFFYQGKADPDKVLDIKQRESANPYILGKEAKTIKQARNHIAHFGFNKDELAGIGKLREAIEKISETQLEDFSLKAKETSKLRAVLTPLGTTEGALYTVLNHFSPDLLVVVTSEQGKGILPNILEKACYNREHRVIIVKNPFTGIEETEQIVNQAKEYLKEATEVVINLTGGTTFLSYVIERIRDEIRHGRTIKSVLAADERPYEEQKKNPYVVGKILELPR
ncbi:CRISPR-associated DxTHG motif protein [Pseudothermotoga sp. U03pept]|uniref:CRISPR-associated DxTHG motif protein n=1 Tax=Pseudothermotoga sp. U03pept TaxID=3447012 RepID=UPI003F04F068